jgi:hypothetical protein
MADAVGRLGAIDRRACREDCERRFSADRIVDEYLGLARSLVRREADAQDLATAQQYAIERLPRRAHP